MISHTFASGLMNSVSSYKSPYHNTNQGI